MVETGGCTLASSINVACNWIGTAKKVTEELEEWRSVDVRRQRDE